MIDKLISALLMLDGNETINLSKDNQNAFKNLIVQISRIKYGVRWHEYDRDCSCQPEWRIMTLLTDVEFKEFLERKEGIAFVKEAHNEDSIEFKTFPKHCVKGTSEAELVDELKPYEKDALVYLKNSTSAMFAKNFLRDIDEMINLRNVIITGCCTERLQPPESFHHINDIPETLHLRKWLRDLQ